MDMPPDRTAFNPWAPKMGQLESDPEAHKENNELARQSQVLLRG